MCYRLREYPREPGWDSLKCVTGYENIHENLAKIELEALTLLEVVQSTETNISGKVEKEGDKIAALDISENLLWLQVILSRMF
jgi:hypothetical protein